MRKKKKTIWLIAIIAAVLLAISLIFRKGESGIKVAIEKAELRTITEIVSVNGKIQPEFEVKISADISGEIIEMAVKEGDSVRQGDLLLKIDPDLYASQLNQLSANLDNGRAALAGNEAQRESLASALNQAKSEFNRIKKLWDQKVVSEQEFEQARLKLETAQANLTAADKNLLAAQYNIKSLAASLEQGRKNLSRTSIFAPTGGIITNLVSKTGERVVGTAQMAGTEIMRISNLNSMEVEVNVNENDIIRIKKGDSANIKVNAWPDRVFKGIVTEIANSARFEIQTNIAEQATSYVVKVRILPVSYADLGSGKSQPFRPGMTATVDIKTVTRTNVIGIPISAVTTREPVFITSKKETKTASVFDEVTRTWVFALKDGKAKAIEVKTGIQDINYFEIISGISAGEEIIIAPGMAIAQRINDGDKVVVVDKSKVFDK